MDAVRATARYGGGSGNDERREVEEPMVYGGLSE